MLRRGGGVWPKMEFLCFHIFLTTGYNLYPETFLQNWKIFFRSRVLMCQSWSLRTVFGQNRAKWPQSGRWKKHTFYISSFNFLKDLGFFVLRFCSFFSFIFKIFKTFWGYMEIKYLMDQLFSFWPLSAGPAHFSSFSLNKIKQSFIKTEGKTGKYLSHQDKNQRNLKNPPPPSL